MRLHVTEVKQQRFRDIEKNLQLSTLTLNTWMIHLHDV